MSKGIVKKTPTVTTKNRHPGKLQVKEIEGSGNHNLLETEIDFDSPSFVVMEGDYVEFALNLAGWSYLSKKVFSRGVITSVTSEQTGTLRMTVVNPNTIGVQKNSPLTYNNYDHFPLAVGDYVEITNMSSTECNVIRKIECVGTVNTMPGETPGSMTVNKVGNNPVGVTVGSAVSIPLPYQGTPPFHVSDIIEFRVVGPGAGKFVEVLYRPS